MSTSELLLQTEEGNNTFFRVDPNTLEVIADAIKDNATVFIKNAEPGSPDRTYQWAERPSLYMARRNDNLIVMIEANSPGPETIFTNGSANQGDRPDDYYLLADNGLMITRNTSNSVMAATSDPNLDPTPKNSVIEGVFAG